MAGEWPQILGPQRNGAAIGEQLLDEWPADGPRQLWTYSLGEGFAGAAVADGKTVVFHRQGAQEVLEALDANNGRSLWKAEFPARYRGGVNPDRGPRCVPLIHDGRVFAYGAAGDLHCVSLDNGDKAWSRTLAKDYDTVEGYFGAGSTPIVAEGLLLVNVGGKKRRPGRAELADGQDRLESDRRAGQLFVSHVVAAPGPGACRVRHSPACAG